MNTARRIKVSCEDCPGFSSGPFCNLSHPELSEVEEQKSVIPYRRGEMIFKAGMRPNGLFCVLSGQVKISSNDEFGNEHITRFAVPGEVIGYRAFLGRDAYQGSAVALEDTRVCHIPASILFAIMGKNYSLSLAMMRLLADALKEAEHRIARLTQRTIRERVAEALLLIEEKFGIEPDGLTIDVRLSRQDIADLTGTVRETATKMLSELQTDGIIALDRKRIAILNRQKLIDRAGIVD